MNRTDLGGSVFDQARDEGIKISRAATQRLVAICFEQMAKALASEDRVVIAGFGSFHAKDRAGFETTNPTAPDGPKLKVGIVRAVRFRSGKALKKAIN